MKFISFALPVSLALVAQSVQSANDAGVLQISAPLSVSPGATFSATIVITNRGDTTWTSAASYNLGAQNPQDNLTWGPGRIPLPTEPVVPGGTVTFTAMLTAPTTPGVYQFAWKMVQDGVEWFGRLALTSINVGVGTQFTPGDLVLLQVGDGFNALATSGSPIFVNNFSLSSLNVTFQVSVPAQGVNALIQGNSQFTGMIDLSTDKHLLVFSGYNTNLPYSSSVESSGSPVPRGVGTINSAGGFALSVNTTTAFNGGTVRGAVTDGLGNFWCGAQNGGIQYLGTAVAPFQVSTLGTGTGVGAIRDLIMIAGSPYFSTSQFPSPGNHGVARFYGAPTSPAEPELVIVTTSIPGAGGTPSAKGFAANTNLTIAYVADVRSFANGGGIYRFNGTGAGNAGSWTYAYTLTNDLDSSATGVFQELAVDFGGAHPRIYATTANTTSTGNSLVSAEDTGSGSQFTLLATAPAGTAYRGVTFAPAAAPGTMSVSRSGADVVISWTGTGTLLSATNVAGPYSPVAGAPTSPYTNTAPTGSQFYRVSVP